ncbi:MAG TPA: hypothetical protein VFR85_19395 [Anaeromyxobacteraceae bacterium]|nr:hypothetical protein [Anaeromyxobacteraceae bacterium]
MSEAVPSVVRLKIPCADKREFLERFAPRYAQKGVFVPGGRPRPVGSRLHLKLEFRDGTVGVSGDALVTGQGTSERPGMVLRFTALDPGSLQFELSPVGGAAPAEASQPDEGQARGELADQLFGSEPQGEPRGSATPLEVRTGKVKLKLRETPRGPGAPATTPSDIPSLASDAGPRTPPGMEGEPAGPRRRGLRFGVAPTVLFLGMVAAVSLAVAGSLASNRAKARTARLEAEIEAADARMREGRLTQPPGDSALDRLLSARALAAGDARVQSRLGALADTFERLGTAAAAGGDLRQAAIHLEAALRADPARAGAARQLEEVKARLAAGPPQAKP